MKGSNSDIELQTIPNKWLTLTRAELVDCDQVGKIVWLLVVSVTQFSLELHIYCSCHCTVSLKNHLSFLKLCLLKSMNVLKDDWIISYVPLRNVVNLLSFKLTTWTCFIFSIITFTFMHLADAFIQSDLQCSQAIHSFISMCSLGIEPTTFCAANAMLYHWATGLYHRPYEMWQCEMCTTL